MDRLAFWFSSLVENLPLKQHITGPTHRGGHTLDLILSYKIDRLVSRSYVGEVFSDHFLIGCRLFLRKLPPPLITVSSRNLKDIDDESFSTDLRKLPL